MRKAVWILAALILLTGCWDERQFKNISLVLSMGFDVGEEDAIKQTVSIPTVTRSSEGPGQEFINVLSTEAHTPREARDKIDMMISDNFDPSKVRVVVFGEELAKEGIFPVLDDMYRDPKSNLNAYMAVVEKGTAEEVTRLKVTGGTRISEYLGGMLETAASSTHTTGENLQLLCAELIEPGIDFSVPLIQLDEQNEAINFSGMGLFHERTYTGEKISAEQSTLYMLLQGKRGKIARLTEKVSGENDEITSYATVEVNKMKRNMKLTVDDGVKADIYVNLQLKVVEYPSDHLYVKGKIKMLEKELTDVLIKESEKILTTLQEANSDVFGIGRRVKAYHPDYWKEIEWSEEFPEIEIVPHFEVKIIEHGIMN
ncbi:Ger(x)C family spore germination protein [Halobacillus litoralis]|uniref:Ger(X)C family spore germination protein n=1 Tax=Halobacillus litoralis TaxID=45668 RepID=A0A845DW40_9BACI|nr:Ger(x)C family spore germination protein [Halobacillus litoralis]MYL18297.1 Ger(x)C family spore germination protein [Halobacillus litoralis]